MSCLFVLHVDRIRPWYDHSYDHLSTKDFGRNDVKDGRLVVQLEWEPPADCGGAPVASYEVRKCSLRKGQAVSVAICLLFLTLDANFFFLEKVGDTVLSCAPHT